MKEGIQLVTSRDIDHYLEAHTLNLQSVLQEIKQGNKTSDWSFIFPQIEELADDSENYSICDRAEAEAYISNPNLISNFVSCLNELLCHKSIRNILGKDDLAKFKSSLTLFKSMSMDESLTAKIQCSLDTFFGSSECVITEKILRKHYLWFSEQRTARVKDKQKILRGLNRTETFYKVIMSVLIYGGRTGATVIYIWLFFSLGGSPYPDIILSYILKPFFEFWLFSEYLLGKVGRILVGLLLSMITIYALGFALAGPFFLIDYAYKAVKKRVNTQ